MITPFLALVRKDLLLFFVDRRAVIMSFVAPILIASFFGFIFGGQSGKTETSKIAVMVSDQDRSVISRALTERLTGEQTLAVKPAGVDEAREAVRKGTTTVAIVIPAKFGEQASRAFFRGGTKPEIGMLYDPSHSAEFSMTQGILTGDVMQVVSKEMFSGQTGRQSIQEALSQMDNSGLPPADKKALRDLMESVQAWNSRSQPGQGSELSGGLTMPYSVRPEAVTAGKGVEYNGYAHAFGGMGVQFVLFMGIDVGIGVLLQRQRGLWKRFRAAPLSRGVLLGSRAVSAAIAAMLIMLTIFAFARAVFGVKVEGSMAGFLGVCAAFALMTATFGLLIAAIGKTPDATRGLSILVTLIIVMLGGSWVPTFIFPAWLQKLTVVVPTRWANDGLDAMTWRGLDISAAYLPIAMLLLFSLLFGVLAVMRFRWEAEG
jgi:ABC-2 type transport system permease protein